MAEEVPFYAPQQPQQPTRTASPGFKLWELRRGDPCRRAIRLNIAFRFSG